MAKKSVGSERKAPAAEVLQLRRNFRALILDNPNYFGNLEKSTLKAAQSIQSNTTFEEIGCVGYHPQLERLHAVVYVNQTSGYGGSICSKGTPEYVRFYLSSDNGTTWQDQGLASFTAFDIPENKDRLEYAVTRRIDPRRRFCFQHNILLARAILSWNVVPPPNTPNFKPVWGEVHDTRIAVDGIKLFPLKDLFKAANVKIADSLEQVLDLRSEEHTSELQSPCNIVCRLLLEKKKQKRRSCMTC